ncbi:MAG: signal peptidase II [bacterium]|nr:signal peptidase II [bacterium]
MIFFIIAFIVVILDQLSKLGIIYYAQAQGIPVGHSLMSLGSFLDIVYITNPGAAFGIFPDQRWVFIAISIIAIVGILFYVWRYKQNIPRWSNIGFSLIFGGAIGNLIDRLVRVEVVDFIDVHIGRYHWPAFNVADSAICVGVGLIILELFRKSKIRFKRTNADSNGYC